VNSFIGVSVGITEKVFPNVEWIKQV